MSTLASFSLLGFILLATACGARSTSNNVGNGSNTNWLSGCASDAKCGGDVICASGACTETCENNDDCSHLHPDAKCTDAVTFVSSDSASCDDVEPRRVCTPSCEKESDCADIGGGFTCTSGACVPAACVNPTPVSACDGKACGEYCLPCPPSEPQCEVDAIVYQCNAEGDCVPGVFSCTEDECAGLAPNQCADNGCVVIDGHAVTGECSELVPVGCAPSDSGDSAISCALDPESAVCYRFPTTTSPSGWETLSCEDARCVLPDCPADECFSPTRNLDRAYDGEIPGCPCNPEEGDICIGETALTCYGGEWNAVIDGPCYPTEQPCTGFISDPYECISLFNTCDKVGDVFCGVEPLTLTCADGVLVQSANDCPPEATDCTQVDGDVGSDVESDLWCASPLESLCPEYYSPTRICAGPAFGCLSTSELFQCKLRAVTADVCRNEGGTPVADPGDGSVVKEGCGPGFQATASVSDFVDDGALCCFAESLDAGAPDAGTEE